MAIFRCVQGFMDPNRLVPVRAVRSWSQYRTGLEPKKFKKSRTSSDQDREKFQSLGPGQGQQKFQNLGPDRTRTKKNFQTWDQTGPGPGKFSKIGTGLNQDTEKFKIPGPIRTPSPGGPWIPGCVSRYL